MTIPLSRSRSCLSVDDYATILHHLEGKNALALGPGLGTEPQTRELVARLYREIELPMVVDADALNILALQPDLLPDPPAPRILTPHPGEMARLSGTTGPVIQADRLQAGLNLVRQCNSTATAVTLILKGAGTVICDPAGTWAINTSGNPGMAAGGMGDVLTGIVGGLLAQGRKPATAARLGVYVHGLAADRLAAQRQFGYLASEVAETLPLLFGAHAAGEHNP
jgi:NAD(P)H-hydrate epimerase